MEHKRSELCEIKMTCIHIQMVIIVWNHFYFVALDPPYVDRPELYRLHVFVSVDGFPYDLLARTEDCRVFVSLDTFNTALGLDPKFAHTSLVNRLLQGNGVPLSDHLVCGLI